MANSFFTTGIISTGSTLGFVWGVSVVAGTETMFVKKDDRRKADKIKYFISQFLGEFHPILIRRLEATSNKLVLPFSGILQ